jgi:hypothetical protein
LEGGIMDALIRLLEHPAFISFIATYGLATVIVIYIIFFRDPRRYEKLTKRYEILLKDHHNLIEDFNKLEEALRKQYKDEFDNLCESYKKLREAYDKLQHDMQPETRPLSNTQAIEIAELGLDRDLYKLYYYTRQKLEGKTDESLDNFMAQSIMDTNKVWEHFISPFPKVPCIGKLYGVYKNQGGKLKKELEETLHDNNKEDDAKKVEIWDRLLKNTIAMKREFRRNIETLETGGEVNEYQEKTT